MLNEIEWLDEFSGLVATSVTASDFCRKLVHSKLTGPGATGAHVFTIDQQARFGLVGSYGQGIHIGDLSVWDEHPYGESARSGGQVSKDMESTEGPTVRIYALPLVKGEEPVGLLSLTMKPGSEVAVISDTARSTISKVGAIWLESLGLGNNNGNNGTGPLTTLPSPETLTDRQMAVLRGMAEGKTNAQMAQEMILSESTIRQETVKIYRSLGVGSRTEAAKRALHLGLLNRVGI